MSEAADYKPAPNFITNIIAEDMESDKWGGRVCTRFPPEPNGYLHIGHAKSICLNFGTAQEWGGECHMRFDDTNPVKENEEFTEAILADVRWMGFDWGEKVYYASDYFEELYQFAVRLIEMGKAYVDDQSGDEIRAARGTLTEPGQDSPWRGRSIAENMDLFTRMRAGEFPDGSKVLRAKIDMASPNLNMRDPVIYRIRHVAHHRTGAAWCIYPMYDFTHCLSDSLERVTHSICTMEFEDNRALYDWVLDQVAEWHSRQYEFARLNLEYTVLSKRVLINLVNEGIVEGWDDPRMPTLVGMRRRGFTAKALRDFCHVIGVGKKESWVPFEKLEKALRDDLNPRVRRVMGVLDPIKVVITNYPEDQVDLLDAAYFPDEPSRMGYRQVPFTRELYIEREDFMEDPPKKFWRMAPGREVRLRWAYLVTCTEVVKDPDTGEVTEIHCTYDPETRGGDAPDGRKVKGTIHWVSATQGVPAQVRLYDRLFNVPNPLDNPAGGSFRDHLNPESLVVMEKAVVEPSLAQAQPGERFQFERKGYFIADPKDSREGALVFNRSVTLRDTWAKLVQKGKHD